MMKHIYYIMFALAIGFACVSCDDYIMFALAIGFACVSCDEHEPIDLDIHPGYILCSDGQIVSPSVFNRDVHTPVAVVFAEKTDQHQALAVLLDEIAPVAFADTLSFDQKTSGSETEYDGYVNTVALQTTHLDRDSLVVKDNKADPRNYYTSPLGLLAFRHTRHLWACWPSVTTGSSRVTMCRVWPSWDCCIVRCQS